MGNIYNNGDGSYRYNNKTYNNEYDAERDRSYDLYREQEERKKRKKGKDEKIGCLPTIFLIGVIPVLINYGWKAALVYFFGIPFLVGILLAIFFSKNK